MNAGYWGSILDGGSPDQYEQALVPGTGGFELRFSAGDSLGKVDFSWDWEQAIADGVINGSERPSYAGPIPSAHGFLASAVIKRGEFYSDRDATFQGKLRASLQFVSVPNADRGLDQDDLGPPFMRDERICLYNCGQSFVHPGEEWMKQIGGGGDLFNHSMLVQLDLGTDLPFAIAARTEQKRIHFGAVLQETAAWSFPDKDMPWESIATVESIAYLRANEISARAMLVAPQGSGAERAYVVFSDAQGVYMADDMASLSGAGLNGVMALAAEEEESGPVEIPDGGKALFSASRRELLLVGGTDLPSSARLRRYLVDTGDVVTIPVDPAFAPSAQVHGAAFDFRKNRLFVLDVSGLSTRLVQHDLDGIAPVSQELWRAKYSNAFESAFLGQAEDGQLVLAVTTSGTYTAWTIDVRAGHAHFSGRIDGEGTPIAMPVMGIHSLVMAVLTSDGVQYVDLAAGRFREGVACDGL